MDNVKEGFPSDSMVKNPPANAGDTGDTGLIPGWRRSPGEENGNPLQYSCLGNPMDRGVQQATVNRVAPPALGAQSLSHWTTREVPTFCILNNNFI